MPKTESAWNHKGDMFQTGDGNNFAPIYYVVFYDKIALPPGPLSPNAMLKVSSWISNGPPGRVNFVYGGRGDITKEQGDYQIRCEIVSVTSRITTPTQVIVRRTRPNADGGCTNGCMYTPTHGCMAAWLYCYMDEWTNGCVDEWTHRVNGA